MNEIQRLILANQYLILSKLDKENQEHYERQAKIIEYGYELDLKFSLEERVGCCFSENKCRFVIDVLQMYHDIIMSYEMLRENEATLELNESTVRFPGFDGNDESAYLNYARFILEERNRFDYVKKYPGDDYNSHHPTIDMYKRNLRTYDEIKEEKGVHYLPLSQSEIKEIVCNH